MQCGGNKEVSSNGSTNGPAPTSKLGSPANTATADQPEAPANEAKADLPTWRFDGNALLPEVPEPSGLAYHPGRNTFFIVDDGDIERPAALFEISLEAEVVQKLVLGIDLEGVCYCPLDGLLYVAEEMANVVYVVEPEGLEQVGAFAYAADYGGEPLLVAGGNGVEGIEFIPDKNEPAAGYFLLLNQDDPHCLFRLNHEDINLDDTENDLPIRAWWPFKEINAGSLHYDQSKNELWLVHSWMNVVEYWDVGTMQVKGWEVFPGAAQEAVAVDGEGRLWVGSDLGGLARYVLAAGEGP